MRLPPELILRVIDTIPCSQPERGECHIPTIRNARLVSQAWGELLLRALFQNVRVALYRKGAGRVVEDAHTWEMLCSFFADNPSVAAVIETLAVTDELACSVEEEAEYNSDDENRSGDAENEGEDVDDEDEHNNGENSEEEQWYRYHCATDPALLRRTLSHLPHLSHLFLDGVLVQGPLLSSPPALRIIPLRLTRLYIALPGWDCLESNCTRLNQLVSNTITIFDSVHALRVEIGYEDLTYVGLEDTDTSRDQLATAFQVKSLEAWSTTKVFVRTLLAHPTFSSLTSLSIEANPRQLNDFFPGVASTLTALTFHVFEPSPVVPGKQATCLLTRICRLNGRSISLQNSALSPTYLYALC